MAGARSFTDLHRWKLANELKLDVYAVIKSPAVERDCEFRNQIRNAAASAPRNIAEGFGRYQHPAAGHAGLCQCDRCAS